MGYLNVATVVPLTGPQALEWSTVGSGLAVAAQIANSGNGGQGMLFVDALGTRYWWRLRVSVLDDGSTAAGHHAALARVLNGTQSAYAAGPQYNPAVMLPASRFRGAHAVLGAHPAYARSEAAAVSAAGVLNVACGAGSSTVFAALPARGPAAGLSFGMLGPVEASPAQFLAALAQRGVRSVALAYNTADPLPLEACSGVRTAAAAAALTVMELAYSVPATAADAPYAWTASSALYSAANPPPFAAGSSAAASAAAGGQAAAAATATWLGEADAASPPAFDTLIDAIAAAVEASSAPALVHCGLLADSAALLHALLETRLLPLQGVFSFPAPLYRAADPAANGSSLTALYAARAAADGYAFWAAGTGTAAPSAAAASAVAHTETGMLEPAALLQARPFSVRGDTVRFLSSAAPWTADARYNDSVLADTPTFVAAFRLAQGADPPWQAAAAAAAVSVLATALQVALADCTLLYPLLHVVLYDASALTCTAASGGGITGSTGYLRLMQVLASGAVFETVTGPVSFATAAGGTRLNALHTPLALQAQSRVALVSPAVASPPLSLAIVGPSDQARYTGVLPPLMPTGTSQLPPPAGHALVFPAPGSAFVATDSALGLTTLAVMAAAGTLLVVFASVLWRHRYKTAVRRGKCSFAAAVLAGGGALVCWLLVTVGAASPGACTARVVLPVVALTLLLGPIIGKTYHLRRRFDSVAAFGEWKFKARHTVRWLLPMLAVDAGLLAWWGLAGGLVVFRATCVPPPPVFVPGVSTAAQLARMPLASLVLYGALGGWKAVQGVVAVLLLVRARFLTLPYNEAHLMAVATYHLVLVGGLAACLYALVLLGPWAALTPEAVAETWPLYDLPVARQTATTASVLGTTSVSGGAAANGEVAVGVPPSLVSTPDDAYALGAVLQLLLAPWAACVTVTVLLYRRTREALAERNAIAEAAMSRKKAKAEARAGLSRSLAAVAPDPATAPAPSVPEAAATSAGTGTAAEGGTQQQQLLQVVTVGSPPGGGGSASPPPAGAAVASPGTPKRAGSAGPRPARTPATSLGGAALLGGAGFKVKEAEDKARRAQDDARLLRDTVLLLRSQVELLKGQVLQAARDSGAHPLASAPQAEDAAAADSDSQPLLQKQPLSPQRSPPGPSRATSGALATLALVEARRASVVLALGLPADYSTRMLSGAQRRASNAAWSGANRAAAAEVKAAILQAAATGADASGSHNGAEEAKEEDDALGLRSSGSTSSEASGSTGSGASSNSPPPTARSIGGTSLAEEDALGLRSSSHGSRSSEASGSSSGSGTSTSSRPHTARSVGESSIADSGSPDKSPDQSPVASRTATSATAAVGLSFDDVEEAAGTGTGWHRHSTRALARMLDRGTQTRATDLRLPGLGEGAPVSAARVLTASPWVPAAAAMPVSGTRLRLSHTVRVGVAAASANGSPPRAARTVPLPLARTTIAARSAMVSAVLREEGSGSSGDDPTAADDADGGVGAGEERGPSPLSSTAIGAAGVAATATGDGDEGESSSDARSSTAASSPSRLLLAQQHSTAASGTAATGTTQGDGNSTAQSSSAAATTTTATTTTSTSATSLAQTGGDDELAAAGFSDTVALLATRAQRAISRIGGSAAAAAGEADAYSGVEGDDDSSVDGSDRLTEASGTATTTEAGQAATGSGANLRQPRWTGLADTVVLVAGPGSPSQLRAPPPAAPTAALAAFLQARSTLAHVPLGATDEEIRASVATGLALGGGLSLASAGIEPAEVRSAAIASRAAVTRPWRQRLEQRQAAAGEPEGGAVSDLYAPPSPPPKDGGGGKPARRQAGAAGCGASGLRPPVDPLAHVLSGDSIAASMEAAAAAAVQPLFTRTPVSVALQAAAEASTAAARARLMQQATAPVGTAPAPPPPLRVSGAAAALPLDNVSGSASSAATGARALAAAARPLSLAALAAARTLVEAEAALATRERRAATPPGRTCER